MKVWVIWAYSYDPEPIQGVFSSLEKAAGYLHDNKWEYTCLNDGHTYRWEHPDGWLRADIVEMEVI